MKKLMVLMFALALSGTAFAGGSCCSAKKDDAKKKDCTSCEKKDEGKCDKCEKKTEKKDDAKSDD